MDNLKSKVNSYIIKNKREYYYIKKKRPQVFFIYNSFRTPKAMIIENKKNDNEADIEEPMAGCKMFQKRYLLLHARNQNHQKIFEKRASFHQQTFKKSDECQEIFAKLKTIDEFVSSGNKFSSSQSKECKEFLSKLRNLVATNQPLQKNLETNSSFFRALALLVVGKNYSRSLRYEALYSLAIFSNFSIPQDYLKDLLVVLVQASENNFGCDIQGQALLFWEKFLYTIGNVIIDKPEVRQFLFNKVLAKNIVNMLYMKDTNVVSLGVWCLRNLLRNCEKDWLLLFNEYGYLKALWSLITSKTTPDGLLKDCCWALAFISENKTDYPIFSLDLLNELSKLCLKAEVTVAIPCLAAISNTVGNYDRDSLIMLLQKSSLLELLSKGLYSDSQLLLREVLFTFSNLFATCDFLIEYCIKNSEIIARIEALMVTKDIYTLKESLFCFINILSSGNGKYIKPLLDTRQQLTKSIRLAMEYEPMTTDDPYYLMKEILTKIE